jgi:hypothetical protein
MLLGSPFVQYLTFITIKGGRGSKVICCATISVYEIILYSFKEQTRNVPSNRISAVKFS